MRPFGLTIPSITATLAPRIKYQMLNVIANIWWCGNFGLAMSEILALEDPALAYLMR